jgi:hypothetical protein
VHTVFLRGDLQEEPGIDGSIILKCIFKKRDGGHELDLSGLG